MGYRSEVVLAISKEAAPYFMAMLAKNPETKRLCEEADTFQGDFDNEGSWIIHWDGIKWYEGYPEIDSITEFMEGMASQDLTSFGDADDSIIEWDRHYRFVRVGEDHEDIEVEGNGEWHIYPQTSIHIG